MIRRVAIALALVALFVIANRAAFEGYFSDDDLDNLSWATVAGTPGLLRDFVSLRFSENNTRATGALFYKATGLAYGLDFPRYVPWLFGIHLLNMGLLGWLAWRRSGNEWGAWGAAIFWGFHAALLEAWWKPMYCFDLLCGTFCLVTWLVWGAGRTWWGLLPFLVAYRAKEVAVFLPVAMAFDDWRRIWPYLLVSGSFTLQAMRVNAGRNNDYTLRFQLQSLMATIPFYAKHLLQYKWGALLLAPLGWFWRERQLVGGVLGTLAMLAPLLFLPKRLFSVYWYVPLIPLALGMAAVLGRLPKAVLALGLALWLGMSFGRLREKRKEELAIAQENRAYVHQLTTFYALRPFPRQIFLEGLPPGLRPHGVQGALILTSGQRDVRILNAEVEADRMLARQEDLMTLQWFRPTQTLSLVPHRYREAKWSEIDLATPQSAWALRGGWVGWENGGRMAGTAAKVALYVPAGARRLEVEWQAERAAGTQILIAGKEVGVGAGKGRESFALPAGTQGEVEFAVQSSRKVMVRWMRVVE